MGNPRIYMLPATYYYEDSKHVTHLNKIKAQAKHNIMNRSPKQLNQRMEQHYIQQGARYLSLGAKAKKEDISKRMG